MICCVEVMLADCIDMNSKIRQNQSTEIEIRTSFAFEEGEGLTEKWQEESFWDEGNISVLFGVITTQVGMTVTTHQT